MDLPRCQRRDALCLLGADCSGAGDGFAAFVAEHAATADIAAMRCGGERERRGRAVDSPRGRPLPHPPAR